MSESPSAYQTATVEPVIVTYTSDPPDTHETLTYLIGLRRNLLREAERIKEMIGRIQRETLDH